MNEAEQTQIGNLLSSMQSPVIVELGAHKGEDGEFFESCIQQGQVLRHVMVEPDPRNTKFIGDFRALHKNKILIEGAIANSSGPRNFHFSEDATGTVHGSGSLLEPSGHIELIPNITFPSEGIVQCFTLDDIFRRMSLSKIDLLWVDIQGAEREMIEGGRQALSLTHYLFMEVENVELYKGQALKPELISMLEGWEVMSDFEFNVLMRNTRYA